MKFKVNDLLKISSVLVITLVVLAAFSTNQITAEGAKTCVGPFPAITSLPYNDSGDTSNATTDNIPSYPGSGLEDYVYANDLIYQITLGEGNNVAFRATGTFEVTDLALFLVSSCGDGSTTVATSNDYLDDIVPEEIETASYPPGTYYLLVDSFASDPPDYPKYGPYALEITGNLGDPGTPTSTSTPNPPELTATAGGSTLTPTSTVPVPTATATVPVATATEGTPVATPTDDGSIELVGNGGFEAPEAALDPWALKNALGDKVKCNTETKVVAHSGLCAFQFKGGAGENTKIQQNLDLSALTLSVGDTLDLSAFVNAKKATASGKIKMTVKYNDTTEAQKVTLTIATTVGYSELVGETLTLAGADVNKIKLMVKHSSPTGKVFVDDVSVGYVAAVAGLGRSSLIPLP
jgi:hypothetical protein